MKAVILVNPYLTEESEFYQPRRIREALSARGVETDVRPNEWRGTGELCALAREYDFCVYLDKDRYAPRVLEREGMRLFNRARAVELCDDKALTYLALEGSVPQPETIFAPLCYKRGAAVRAEAAGEILGYPVVVKECFGSFGEQVYLARNAGELAAYAERLKLRPHLYQKFVAESAGKDLRVIAVGGEVVACMKRTSEHDFRSNIALGGKGEPCDATGEVRTLARTVSAALGLDYCGLDLLFGREGLLVCEVNSNAFFGGIERETGKDVAAAYADHMLREMSARGE